MSVFPTQTPHSQAQTRYCDARILPKFVIRNSDRVESSVGANCGVSVDVIDISSQQFRLQV